MRCIIYMSPLRCFTWTCFHFTLCNAALKSERHLFSHVCEMSSAAAVTCSLFFFFGNLIKLLRFKGIVHPKLHFQPFTTIMLGEALGTFSSSRNHSGVSQWERFAPNANPMEACVSQVLQHKKSQEQGFT